MNLIQIAGHLGADPESRFTSSGQKVTNLRVAARVRRGGQDRTIWWRITVWGEQFDKMISFLKKGSAVMVMAEMHEPEIFTNRDGNPQVSMNATAVHISFSPFGKSERNQESNASALNMNESSEESMAGFASGSVDTGQQNQPKTTNNLDDEIPF